MAEACGLCAVVGFFSTRFHWTQLSMCHESRPNQQKRDLSAILLLQPALFTRDEYWPASAFYLRLRVGAPEVFAVQRRHLSFLESISWLHDVQFPLVSS
jgi:hypothetical protein